MESMRERNPCYALIGFLIDSLWTEERSQNRIAYSGKTMFMVSLEH